jgi:hypothetical protein
MMIWLGTTSHFAVFLPEHDRSGFCDVLFALFFESRSKNSAILVFFSKKTCVDFRFYCLKEAP